MNRNDRRQAGSHIKAKMKRECEEREGKGMIRGDMKARVVVQKMGKQGQEREGV
jgi:hypothetical protein